MQDVQDISGLFGPKYSDLAQAIDQPADNVRKWLKQNRIPEAHFTTIVEAARLRGHVLSIEDILKANRPQKPRPGRPKGKITRLKRRSRRTEMRA